MSGVRRWVVAGVLLVGGSLAMARAPHAAPAAAPEHSAGWLYQTCRSKDAVSRDGCAAYLLGAADVMAVIGKATPRDKDSTEGVSIGLCGSKATGETLIRVFTEWVDRHPTQWRTPMVATVMQAFAEKWPCGT